MSARALLAAYTDYFLVVNTWESAEFWVPSSEVCRSFTNASLGLQPILNTAKRKSCDFVIMPRLPRRVPGIRKFRYLNLQILSVCHSVLYAPSTARRVVTINLSIMARNSEKRVHSVIDLTGDDINHENKRARTSGNFDEEPSSSSNDFASSSRDSWADATSEVVSTQAFDDDELQSLRHYGTVDNKIVGVRYYNGRATTGEFVVIRREPGNPYDKNAVRIDNVVNTQIGWSCSSSRLWLWTDE